MARSRVATEELPSIARFLAVAEAGSFARGAERMGVPKSTLSRAVARLEQELGVRLVERTSRAVRLTDEGQALRERARAALDGLDEAIDALVDAPNRARGTLRISAPPDLGDVLGGLLTRFASAHPDVRVEVDLSTRYVDLVAEGFDVALRAGTLRDSSLVARKLVDMRFGVFGAPSYLSRNKAPRRVADLAAHPFVLFDPMNRGDLRLTAHGKSERVSVHGSLRATDLSFVRSCVIEGAGLGLLPFLATESEVRAGRLLQVLPEHEGPSGALHAVFPSSRNLPSRVSHFRDFAVDYLRALDERCAKRG